MDFYEKRINSVIFVFGYDLYVMRLRLTKTYDPINTTNAGFNFSEDLAWVKYTDGQDYYGCIDNNGKMLFRCPAESFSEATIFENGYSGLEKQM